MNQVSVFAAARKFRHKALVALSSLLVGLLFSSSTTWANADGFYTGDYDYGGEAVHLYIEVDQRGPETLKLRRLLSREHRVDTNDYILLALVVDNLNATSSGFARLSVDGHKGPNVQTADFQTRLLAPADQRRNWNLYLSRDAHITGLTAILAPRSYSNYRGSDYGYYDRGYLGNSSFYGWIWRDRYYQHPRGHRYFNGRHNPRIYDRYYGRSYNSRDRLIRERRYRARRNNQLRNQPRQHPDQNANQPQRRARPGFGDRNLYEHERAQRPNRDQRVRRNHEYRGDRRSNVERINPARTNRARRNQTRQQIRASAPRAERPRPRARSEARQQTRSQPRAQARQQRAQRRPQLNKQGQVPRRRPSRERN